MLTRRAPLLDGSTSEEAASSLVAVESLPPKLGEGVYPQSLVPVLPVEYSLVSLLLVACC
jgi:hypothetical protein